jgi:hypothetical protein
MDILRKEYCTRRGRALEAFRTRAKSRGRPVTSDRPPPRRCGQAVWAAAGRPIFATGEVCRRVINSSDDSDPGRGRGEQSDAELGASSAQGRWRRPPRGELGGRLGGGLGARHWAPARRRLDAFPLRSYSHRQERARLRPRRNRPTKSRVDQPFHF